MAETAIASSIMVSGYGCTGANAATPATPLIAREPVYALGRQITSSPLRPQNILKFSKCVDSVCQHAQMQWHNCRPEEKGQPR